MPLKRARRLIQWLRKGSGLLIEDFKQMKWLPLTAGALLCLFGLAALAWPRNLVRLLPAAIGVAILVLGACELAAGFAARGAQPRYIVGMHRLHGGVNIAVGLVLLFNRTLSLVFICITLGVWALLFGLLRLRDALRRRAARQPWGGCLADAVAKLVIGGAMLASPLGGLAVWTVLVGLFFLFVGVSVICSALYLDRLPHDFGDF